MTHNEVLRVVASRFGLTEEQLKARSRLTYLVRPRQVAMYAMRHYLGMSYGSIGDVLGGRDHSTVMHACRRVSEEDLGNVGETLRLLREWCSSSKTPGVSFGAGALRPGIESRANQA